MRFPDFIRAVAMHYIIEKPTLSPFRTPLKRARVSPTDVTGPRGEVVVVDVSKNIVCPGGELELRDVRDKKGKIRGLKCKYCWNGRTPRRRRESIYRCSLCKVHVCKTCNHSYHEWLKFSSDL